MKALTWIMMFFPVLFHIGEMKKTVQYSKKTVHAIYCKLHKCKKPAQQSI